MWAGQDAFGEEKTDSAHADPTKKDIGENPKRRLTRVLIVPHHKRREKIHDRCETTRDDTKSQRVRPAKTPPNKTKHDYGKDHPAPEQEGEVRRHPCLQVVHR